MGFTFVTDSNVPMGQGAGVDVEIGATGAIVVKMHPNATFNSFNDLNTLINAKIKDKLGGKEHPGGTFTIEAQNVTFPQGGLTGAELVGTNFGIKRGEVSGTWPTGSYTNGNPGTGVFGGITIDQLGEDFNSAGNISKVEVTYAGGPPKKYTVKIEAGGATFTGDVLENNKGAGRLVLKGPGDKGSIVVNHPGFDGLEDAKKKAGQLQPPQNGPWATTLQTITATNSAPSKDIGLSSRTFKLEGGTKGGPQGIGDVDGIMVGADGGIIAKHPVHGEIAVGLEGGTKGGPQGIGDVDGIMVGADGGIIAKHPVHGEIAVGRIDLVSFANPSGLEQSGSTYFVPGANSGTMKPAVPGSEGTGQIATGSLEQSNVDLSQEFSDMIVTQRAFQANSRIITVTDTMLEELVNLKR